MATTITLLLDRSGSMRPKLDNTIAGVNAYLETVQAAPEANEIFGTLITFDSSSIDTICKGLPVKQIPQLNRENYVPRDSTPLIEALIKTIEAVAIKAVADKVIIVTMTDGEENASAPEYTNARLQALIAEKRLLGWEFISLGAGFDNYGQAARVGIGAVNTMSYDSTNVAATQSAYVSAANASLRGARGQSIDFSAQEKLDAGDKFAVSPAAVKAPEPPKIDRLAVDL